VQVEEIEKPPFEIHDNTDDVSEPMPAHIKIKTSKTQREPAKPYVPSSQGGAPPVPQSMGGLASDVISKKTVA
jgi:hypothetical protein